jgi:hypothetical protein
VTAEERSAIVRVHHDVSNALAVLRSTLESIADGVAPASPERLSALIDSVVRASELLDELRTLTAR